MSSSVGDAAAIERLLDHRAHAVVDGDEAAFRATVADPGSADGARQLERFAAARRLGVALLDHEPGAGPAAAGVVIAQVTYRVAGTDDGDRTTRVRYRVVRTGRGWRVATEEPVGGVAAAPWLVMPRLRVVRGARSVVAGSAPADVLAEQAAGADATLGELAGRWEDTPPLVLVLVPADPSEAAGLLGVPQTRRRVAATTDGPTGPDGRATGDRIVIDPEVRGRLGAPGRSVVLSHELTHVAVRATAPGSPPPWLSEGYADHVGYRRADVPPQQVVASLADAVRRGAVPSELPSSADLDPSRGDITVGYLSAWQAVELIAERYGEDRLRRLVRACASSAGPEAAEVTCDRALAATLGLTRDDLTRAWRARLSALGR